MQQDEPKYTFPDDDLLATLIDLYFRFGNPLYPLLHRPTFEKGIIARLHLHDSGFGGTVLLVCALGARWSDDPRVYYDVNDIPHSAGWTWFKQLPLQFGVGRGATLYDLQSFAVSINVFV